MNDMNQQAPAFPYGNYIVQAFRYVWAERSEFFKMAMLPVVGLSLLLLAIEYFFPGPAIVSNEQGQPVGFNQGVPLQLLVQGIFYCMFAVAWHRKWLVPDEEITFGNALKWDGRKSRFFLRSLGLFLLGVGAGVPLFIFAGILGSAGVGTGGLAVLPFVIVMFLVIARASLWLPAAAVDDPASLKDAWQATSGNSWRMLGLWMGPQIPISIFQIVMVNILIILLGSLGLLPSMTGGLVLNLISQGIYFFGVAVSVSALSMAYVFFRGKPARD